MLAAVGYENVRYSFAPKSDTLIVKWSPQRPLISLSSKAKFLQIM